MSRRTRRRRAGRCAPPAGRTLHLLDIENLAAEPRLDAHTLLDIRSAYGRTVAVRDGDHVVVACDGHNLLEVGLAWPDARVRVGHGPDGADLALLADADPAWIASRYHRVVVGSGDGIFTELVWRLRALGVAVCVVARRESLSRHLRKAAFVLPLRVDVPPTVAA